MLVETTYPLTFREADTEVLARHIQDQSSVVLVGMKRIGISNFLRFFLYHPEVRRRFLPDKNYLFVAVDANDLVALDPLALWTLMLKRLGEAIEQANLETDLQHLASQLLTESWAQHNLLFTFEAVRQVITRIVQAGWYPVLFWLRFDRLQTLLSTELFANLQSLKDAAHYQLSYVFTSYRPLSDLAPTIFTKAALSVFANHVYIKPAAPADMRIILGSLMSRYRVALSATTRQEVIELAGGHVHYLHLAVLKLKDAESAWRGQQLIEELASDEAVALLSNEIADSLTPAELATLHQAGEDKLMGTTAELPPYLLETGLLTAGSHPAVFSPLLVTYLNQKVPKWSKEIDLTKKELALFTILSEHAPEVVERDDIIEAVWPEQVELGVSDWALDRLVARLRTKLRSQGSVYQIVTVVTRGYKLVQI